MFDLMPFGNRYFAAYDPFRELEEMERRMFASKTPSMKTDIRETDKEFLLEAELPGFSKEEIAVQLRDGVLTLRAEHKKDEGEKDEEKKKEKDKDKDKKKDDVVLTEALNILADLVKLTGGNDTPDTPDVSTSAFWSIFGGQQ